jgi:hypothetical protein
MKLVAITLALTGLGFGSWGLCSGTAASAPCASECDATVTCTPGGTCLVECTGPNGSCSIELACDGESCEVVDVNCSGPCGSACSSSEKGQASATKSEAASAASECCATPCSTPCGVEAAAKR